NHPFPRHFTKPALEMFDTLGRYSTFLYKIIFANLWCFGGLLDKLSQRSGGVMNALFRTTVAFTQAAGSKAPNVIPPEASFVANLRLNPVDTVDSAVEYCKDVVGDERMSLSVDDHMNPSPISETDCEAWDKVKTAILDTWEDCIVSPYLMVACSDSRHYGRISNHVYRFSACDLTDEERNGIHGNDEHIRVEVVGRAVAFYLRLIGMC
ncbi:MAG: M20/M25/M40 family metallo-hydrolase, partial [Eubacteriales bacterium]|nr:M20/M25/M40 family metallo-hydrolase [Eubacteriales bacterium]